MCSRFFNFHSKCDKNVHCAVKTVFTLLSTIFFELPKTRTFFRFPFKVRVIGSRLYILLELAYCTAVCSRCLTGIWAQEKMDVQGKRPLAGPPFFSP